MKKARDQARKENSGHKKNAKGKAKAVKSVVVPTGDVMTSVHDAFAKKTTETGAKAAQVSQAAKADAKQGLKRRG